MEPKLIPDPANDIYVRCESGNTIYHTKLNREELHYYLPETQRLLGGRNTPDSTYNDRPCFHLDYVDYEKITHVFIYHHGYYTKVKISRDLFPLIKSTDTHEGLQLYCYDLISKLLKEYPPIKPYLKEEVAHNSRRINIIECDDELEKIIKNKPFPFTIATYYKEIEETLSLDFNGNITISDEDELNKNTWLRNYYRYLAISNKGDYGDLNFVYASNGTFGVVNKLHIEKVNVVFEYADIVFLECENYTNNINCRTLIADCQFTKCTAEVVVCEKIFDIDADIKYWIYEEGEIPTNTKIKFVKGNFETFREYALDDEFYEHFNELLEANNAPSL